jgi:hypothetical protein
MEVRRRVDNQRMPGARILLTVARGAAFTFAGFAARLGGGVACIAATVGVCAAVSFALYGAARLFAYLFGFGFRWGLVTASWLLLVVPPVGALIQDIRMRRRLALPKGSLTAAP